MTYLVDPAHPGEVLKELYLVPLGMSAISLSHRLRIPRARIERLLRCESRLSVDTAMRLSRFFGTSESYWLNMQRAWDVACSSDSDLAP